MNDTSRVSVFRDDGGITIVGEGALDLYTKGFDTKLREAASSAEQVTVDLRSATFIDTAIIASMAGAAKRLRKRGKRLRVLLSDDGHPLRTLRITGLLDMMDLVVDHPEEKNKGT